MKSRRVMALVMPSGSLAILRWDMALALRRPVDIGKEYLQAPFVVDILDSAPAVERGVDMIARGHRYRFAVYRHLSASFEDVIIFVEGAELRVGQIMKVDEIGRESCRERVCQYV